jgi:hypothetical protein
MTINDMQSEEAAPRGGQDARQPRQLDALNSAGAQGGAA